MKTVNHKKTIAIALFLTLTIAVSIVAVLPDANAAPVYSVDTYPFLSVVPNPVGVGQRVVICFWLSLMPPETPADIAAGERASWDGFTVTMTKPDQTTQTFGPFTSDVVGSSWTEYTPDKAGTYYFEFSFAGEWKNTTASDTYYKPSTSPVVEVTVQDEPIPAYPSWPLPTEYWTRPINDENWGWSSLAGNWYGMTLGWSSGYDAYGRFNPYTEAPNTAHIMWANQIGFGGLTGGNFGESSYYSGIQYEQRFYPTIILNGRLYFNLPLGTQRNTGGFVCWDLRTGEELWWQNDTVTFGQIYDYDSPNQHGPIPQLWYVPSMFGGDPNYKVYDPFTGAVLYSFKNCLTGTPTFSADGSVLVYMVGGSYPNRWLAMWNSSAAPALLQGSSGSNAWMWRPYGKTIDWRTGIEWNVTFAVEGNPSISKLAGDKFIWRSTATLDNGLVVSMDSAFDLREGKEGERLWGPINRTAVPSVATGPYGEGVYVSYVKETMEWYGYDASTGALLWGPTDPYTDPFGMYGSTAEIAYGRIYTMSYGGTIYCWNVTSGEPLWEYYTGDAGLETPYGHYPQWEGMAIADGKVIVTSYEHSPDSPIWRGARMHAIDVETGELVWNILGWYQGSGTAIADGYMVQHNYGDDRVYCFGKGPSTTTVTASPKVSVHGNNVLLEGTVIDTAAGTQQDEQAARFPHGVPAIADESMTPWMEYVYMQKPKPTNATGVEVVVSVLDPNNNCYEVGRTTSDVNGFYKMAFEPLVPGEYTVIASFEGSESYWPSQAVTGISVEEAPAATAEPTPPPEGIADAYFVPAIAGIIVAIIVVGIVMVLMLRKR